MVGDRLGELPMTGGKLGNKQSERIAKMVNKHWRLIQPYICIYALVQDVHLYIYSYFCISTPLHRYR